MQCNLILTYRKRRIKPQTQDQQHFQALQGRDDSDSQKSKATLEFLAAKNSDEYSLPLTAAVEIDNTYRNSQGNNPDLSVETTAAAKSQEFAPQAQEKYRATLENQQFWTAEILVTKKISAASAQHKTPFRKPY